MAYDPSGSRSQRCGNGDPGYFDDSSDYSRPSVAEPRARERSTSNARQQSFSINDRMASSPERAELIAEITERVKRERMSKYHSLAQSLVKQTTNTQLVVEHLNRTGSVDDATKAPTTPPLQRQPSNKSSSTSSPPPTARKVYTPPSPTLAQSQTPKPANIIPPMDSAREPVRSPPTSPLEKPSGVRFSDRNPAVRPVAPGRTFSTMELSTVDQKWGRLFDNEGNPTQRLGQFLRGLANHIVSPIR